MQGITLASARAVVAGKSCKPIDVSVCANLGQKAMGEMLQTCKIASKYAESDDDRERYNIIYHSLVPKEHGYMFIYVNNLTTSPVAQYF